MWDRCYKFGQSINSNILLPGNLLDAKAVKSRNQILYPLEVHLQAFLSCLIFIQHMADNELRVVVGLQMLYPWFFGYHKASDQDLIFSFIVSERKVKVEGILDVLSFKVDENESYS